MMQQHKLQHREIGAAAAAVGLVLVVEPFAFARAALNNSQPADVPVAFDLESIFLRNAPASVHPKRFPGS